MSAGSQPHSQSHGPQPHNHNRAREESPKPDELVTGLGYGCCGLLLLPVLILLIPLLPVVLLAWLAGAGTEPQAGAATSGGMKATAGSTGAKMTKGSGR
jgi:hypothetical protein